MKIQCDKMNTEFHLQYENDQIKKFPTAESSEAVIEGGKESTDRDAPLAAEPIHLEEKLERLQNEMKVLSIKNEGLQNQI